MTLEAFQHLWCHNHTLASIHTVQTSTEERLELKVHFFFFLGYRIVHLSDSSPVPLFFFFFFFLGGKDIHYTSAMIATSRVCDVHHKPERPKLTTHLEIFRHES